MSRESPPAEAVAAPGGIPPETPDAAVELGLAPDDLPRLARTPGLLRQGPARDVALIWYDNPAGDLAAQDRILVRDGKVWRLELLRPGDAADWPAVTPSPILDAGPAPATLNPAPPFDAVPVAAFQGRRRAYRAQGVALAVQYGKLRGVVAERSVCRLTLTGPAHEVSAFAHTLALAMRVWAPRATLAVEALAVATGGPVPPRHAGTPKLPGDIRVSDGLARLISHLLDVLLHWLDRCRADPTSEPVHQARVASRRLRSALSVYKRAAACPELEALAPALKHCAARLGAAREWDVFLESTGARLSGSQSDHRQVATLLRAARRRRAEEYATLHAFLASPEWRKLEIGLACAASLRPWERTAEAAPLQRPTAAFAGEALARRMKQVRKAGRPPEREGGKPGRDLEHLPIPALHELRKDCKRLRYTAEFFSAAFTDSGAKIFLKRLADLQEELGLLNDSAGVGVLMGQLGQAGRGFAGGLATGLAATSGGAARGRISKAWRRFRSAPKFWAM